MSVDTIESTVRRIDRRQTLTQALVTFTMAFVVLTQTTLFDASEAQTIAEGMFWGGSAMFLMYCFDLVKEYWPLGNPLSRGEPT